MHGGLLGVAFCPSVCPSVRLSVRPGQILEKRSLEKKSYLRNRLTQGHQILYSGGHGPYLGRL